MSIHYKITRVTTSPYQVLSTDQVISVNVPSPATVILPAPGATTGSVDDETVAVGCMFIVKDTSGTARTFPITIVAAGGLSIDSATFAILNANFTYVRMIFNGVNWNVL